MIKHVKRMTLTGMTIAQAGLPMLLATTNVAFADEQTSENQTEKTTEQTTEKTDVKQPTKEEIREQKLQTLKDEFEKVSGKLIQIDNVETPTTGAKNAKKAQQLNVKSEQDLVKSKIQVIENEIQAEKDQQEAEKKAAEQKEAEEKEAARKAAEDEASKEAFPHATQAASHSQAVPSSLGAVSVEPTANTYPWGQCTWGVKNLAPWAGPFWGNADQWANSAAAEGFEVGTTPVAGAIAVWSGMHVAYVTDVQNEHSIQVLESNYGGNQNIGNYRGWFDPTAQHGFGGGTVSYIYPKK